MTDDQALYAEIMEMAWDRFLNPPPVSLRRAIEIAQRNDPPFAALIIHPDDADEMREILGLRYVRPKR